MIGLSTLLLQRVRVLGQNIFYQFGLHCATHQIRVILISCVVITSLFYPALSLYSSSQPTSLSVIDVFANRSTFPASSPDQDLVNIWSGHDTLRVHEDAVSRAKCGVNRALRVERILIQRPRVEDDVASNLKLLMSTLKLERQLQQLMSKSDVPCLRRADGKCFVLSPLAFWGYDENALRLDKNILDTLSAWKNTSVAGIPITPLMVLARRGSYERHTGSKFDYADFLALTYFFPESDCVGNTEHLQWGEMVRNAVPQNVEVTSSEQEPTLIALEFDPNLSIRNGWSALSTFLYLAYIGFFAYVGWSVRRMDAVHSRLGVTFTALVEIAVSTITSLSVCALVGFKVTMVPWELLPIVIVFVGAENMFNIVDAVGKTSVTLSVKQRIAEGLSRAGTSNTLKVVTYNSILGVIAVFSVGAVRQFCVFATVVLVAHWFLAHTFFLAVLSIDIARLELDELLRRDTSLAPAVRPAKATVNGKEPRSKLGRLVKHIQNLLEGRATTNVSLLMLLAMTATLYYTTYTASETTGERSTTPLGAVSGLTGRFTDSQSSPALHIWKVLNPTKTPLLHLRIEMPTIVTFSRDVGQRDATHFPIRTFRFVFWIIKIMVLPIGATTSVLYGLLLYLLKDTELLEAQRNRADSDTLHEKDEEQAALTEHISFSTLPRAFASDVELLASSKDGRLVVSVGLRNEILVWRADKLVHLSIDATEVLLRSASTSCASSTLTSVTVDEKGRYFAVGTGAGVVAAWAVEEAAVRLFPLMTLDNSSAGITEIQFVSPLSWPGRSPPSSEPNSPFLNPVANITILVTYESGVAARWSVGEFPIVSFFTPSRRAPVVRSSLLHIIPEDRILVAFALNDGSLELVETGDFEPTILPDYHIQPGTLLDLVWKAHACRIPLNGSTRFVITVATEAGTVSLWDGKTAECISVLEDSHGQINHIRVSPVQCETCHFCGQLPVESLSVAFSVDHIVRVFKLFLNDDQSRRCSCSQNQLRHVSSRDVLGRRSRSNSNVSQTSSPMIPRARLATAFESSTFPVSAHGFHSRRASEKETGRRSSELLQVPSSADEDAMSDGSVTPTNTPHSFWQNAVMVRMADVTCERGGWDVAFGKYVGIRRRARTQGRSKGGTTIPIVLGASLHGLSTATLERWELWVFDPAITVLRSTLLASLKHDIAHLPSQPQSSADKIARLPFTRVSPLLVSSSRVLTGFGNTIGVFNFSDS